MPEQERAARLWLALAEGITPRMRQRMLESFGSYAAVFERFPDSFSDIVSLTALDSLTRLKNVGLDKLQTRLQELNIAVAYGGDGAHYPALLETIPDPPDVLFYRGTLRHAEERAVAIVGSRRETRYGRRMAFDIACKLAQQGITVVSGLARGIDTAAHKGALKGGGRTIAVLGSGLSRLYPEENAPLAEEIIASGGAVISELPPTTEPKPYQFPIRNRIVSGLAQALLIVEARDKSGTLITVGHALEQGREVFALPGEVDAPGSVVPHRLIREGAHFCTGAEDLLEDMGWLTAPPEASTQMAFQQTTLTDVQRAIVAALRDESKGFEELLEATGMQAPDLSIQLTLLEMDGHIEALPGRQFAVVRRQ